MSHIIHEQNLNSDSNSGPLNTPSPPMMNQIDTEDRVQGNLSIESMLSNFFPEFMNNVPLSSNPDLLQNTETIISDVRRLKKSTVGIRKNLFKQRKSTKKIETTLHKHDEAIARIETSICRQEESYKRIISLLEKFTSHNENTQQSLRSNLPSEFQLSVPERPTNHEESSNNRNIEDLPSESNSRPTETHRNPIEHTTTKSNAHLLYSPSIEIVDKIRAEKNRGKIQIGQWCYEINVGTTDDAPALLPPTTTKKLGNQLQNKEPPMNYQFSCQTKTTTTTTTNENLLSTSSKCISMKLSFVHPLNTHIRDKTDRDTTLTDCYGKTPVLLLDGENLPDNIDLQIAAISKSSKGCFQSIFRFSDGKNKYNDFDYRSIKISRESSLPLKFELNNLKLRKRSNQSMKIEETFILKHYPSEEIENTKIDKLKELNEQYKFAEIQLAFSCDKKIISYSNLLSISTKQSDQYELEIETIYPDKNTTINFNNDNQCLMEFFIKIPEPFHCTLASRYKWIEISIISNDSINSIYLIDIENGEKKNPNYINIEHPSFKIPFKIIKQTTLNVIESLITGDINSILPINEFDRFCIKFKLLHSEVVPCERSLKEYYINCPPWESQEFIENKKTGQKRTNEVIFDENNEWITNKTAKTSENVNTIVQCHDKQDSSIDDNYVQLYYS